MIATRVKKEASKQRGMIEARSHLHSEGSNQTAAYQFSRELVIEPFEDEALLLVAEQDRFLTVNRAALDLIELMRGAFGERAFSVPELAALLEAHYDLSSERCTVESAAILAAWFEQGILTLPGDGPRLDTGTEWLEGGLQ
jgi:hypothetical protein